MNCNMKRTGMLLVFLLTLMFIYHTTYSQSGIITFDELRYRSALDVKIYNGGPGNTLQDTEMGVDFIIAYGEMWITRMGSSGSYWDYMLFFSPIITATYPSTRTDPVGRVVIRFSNAKEYVRVKVSHDEHPIKDTNYYFTVKFYRDYTPSNALHSEDLTNAYLSWRDVEYSNTSNGIMMVILDSHFAENNLTEIEFRELGAEPSVPSSTTALSGYSGAVPLAWNKPDDARMQGAHNSQVLMSYISHPDATTSFGLPIAFTSGSGTDDIYYSAPTDVLQETNSLALIGYDVYRSTSQTGSYSRIAERISRQYYRDESVINGQNYYYKVKAVYNTGTSDFSDASSAQPEANGFIVTSGWTNTPPSLNGTINSSEWANAGTTTITYLSQDETVVVYAMNDNNKLYLAVDDQRNQSLGTNDTFGILFDDDYNREWPPSSPSNEGLIQLYWSSDNIAKCAFQPMYGIWPDQYGGESWRTPAGVNQGISYSGGRVQIEGSFDLATSPITAAPGESIGIFFYTWEGSTGEFTGLWPQQTERLQPMTSGYGWAHGPFSYADLILATQVTPPSAPSNLTATAVSTSQINLTWRDNSDNENGFKIERREGTIGSWQTIYTTTANAQSYNDQGLKANTTYYYRVYAFSSQGNSSYSNIASATTAQSCTIQVISPNGGENWQAGTRQNITWTSSGTSGYVKIRLSTVTGVSLNWLTIIENTPDDNVYEWDIPRDINNDKCRISISDVNNSSCSGLSESDFSIIPAVQLPAHWTFTERTGNSANVALPTTANPNIDGVPLMNGDYVGVFTPAGLCCGYRQWQGSSMIITVWGDNSETTVTDGFKPGELINYRVFRASTQKEWASVTVGYADGSGNYSPDAFMELNRFDVRDELKTILSFAQGWNMFSINVNPADANIADMMSSIVDKVKIVKNNNGDTYVPRYGINDIGNVNYKEGYQIYMLQAANLDVGGQFVEPTTPISLPAGWSMISYLPSTPMDAIVALASISSQLKIAKNNAGETYVPRYGINDIRNMQPGQGYQVYLTAAGTLVYPAGINLDKVPVSLTQVHELQPDHFRFSKTGENATLVLPVIAIHGNSSLESGDEIGIFTSNGLCCGAAVWQGTNTAITIWGDDVQTEEIDGCKPGAEIYFRVWKKSTNEEYTAQAGDITEDALRYQKDGFAVLTQFVADANKDIAETNSLAIPVDFKLLQNHPNPFNPETTIEYHLPFDADVKMVIYDLRGHEVRALVTRTMTAGYHSVFWDGRNSSGQLVSSGVYFYRIEVKNPATARSSIFDVKKMIFMK